MNPADLLAQRQRDYRKAQDRHARALERLHAAGERVQALERELAAAEDEDRRALGDALVDNERPPARKSERARTALEKAKSELEALQYAAERAAQALDRMPVERRSDWLRQAQQDFQAARSDYEQELDHLIAARQRLVQEAELLSFLSGGQIGMAPRLRVSVGDVWGLSSEVVVEDTLAALRDELATLEFDALRGARA